MREKRQIFHAEVFQMIYVDSLPSKWGNITPHSLV